MNEILNLSIDKMAGCSFDCSCGKHHSFTVHDMFIKKDALLEIPNVAKPFKDGKIMVVYDNNTYKVAGKRVVELLKDNGFNVKELMFDKGEDILLPNEATFGRIVMEQDLDVNLMVAVGGGVINDSVKFVTSRSKIPYIIVATAPSMDGYVANGAAILCDGHKINPIAQLTYGLIADTDVLKTAPSDLIAAGFGDVVGKITAMVDWDLAVKANGDYRCDTCVTLVNRALEKCFATVDGLKTRDGEALEALMDALTLTGVAMKLIDSSRPASGAEHLLSHYWEMDYVERGLNPNHHGVQVGVGTPIIARCYEYLKDIIPEGVIDLCPPHEEIEDLLRRAGSPISPAEIGITKDLFHESMLKAYDIRPRYNILQFAVDKGRINDLADAITDMVY